MALFNEFLGLIKLTSIIYTIDLFILFFACPVRQCSSQICCQTKSPTNLFSQVDHYSCYACPLDRHILFDVLQTLSISHPWPV